MTNLDKKINKLSKRFSIVQYCGVCCGRTLFYCEDLEGEQYKALVSNDFKVELIPINHSSETAHLGGK